MQEELHGFIERNFIELLFRDHPIEIWSFCDQRVSFLLRIGLPSA